MEYDVEIGQQEGTPSLTIAEGRKSLPKALMGIQKLLRLSFKVSYGRVGSKKRVQNRNLLRYQHFSCRYCRMFFPPIFGELQGYLLRKVCG